MDYWTLGPAAVTEQNKKEKEIKTQKRKILVFVKKRHWNFYLSIVAIKDVVLHFCWFGLYFIQSKRNQFAPSQFDTCQFHKYRILGHFMFPEYETLMFQQSYKVIKFWHRDRKSISCRLQKKLIPKQEFICWARIKQLKKQMLKLAFSTMETFLKVEKELDSFLKSMFIV